MPDKISFELADEAALWVSNILKSTSGEPEKVTLESNVTVPLIDVIFVVPLGGTIKTDRFASLLAKPVALGILSAFMLSLVRISDRPGRPARLARLGSIKVVPDMLNPGDIEVALCLGNNIASIGT